MVQSLFGLKILTGELTSERDQNFLVRDEEGREYVLKIANASERREILEFQNKAMAYLGEQCKSYDWPRVIPTLSKMEISPVVRGDGSTHFVRLLTYLPGRFLAYVKPHKPELLRSFGAFLAAMDKALAGFAHEPVERELRWDMRQAPATIRKFIRNIQEAERRKLVERFLRQYEEHTKHLLKELRAQVIHNDANDYNVLVGHVSLDPGERFSRVTGIIDFGDMIHGYTVGDLAIGAAYAMMGKKDAIGAAVHIVRGYHEALPLTEAEIEALYPLILMRLCMSVTIAAEQQIRESDNEYLRISEKPAWELLSRLRDVSPSFAHYAFRHACGYAPCPQTRAVVDWLKANPEKIGRIVGLDLTDESVAVLGLGVEGCDISEIEGGALSGAPSGILLGKKTESEGKVRIGRYNEPRQFYTSNDFRTEGNDGYEWRTVHLGLDLFLEEGSPVFSPLDGAVHSFRDNAAPQDYGPTIILEHRIPGGAAFYSLFGHLSRGSLAGLRIGKPVRKGERMGSIGHPAENGGWPPHLHYQLIMDMLENEGQFPGIALPSQRDIWLSLCPDPNIVLGIPEKCITPTHKSKEEIIRLRRELISPTLSISYKMPLEIVRGFMQYLYDENGQAYLDAVNNVPHVGHCHPRVVEAIRKQAAVLNTNTRYLHDYLIEYARRLAETLPEPLRVFFFVCSGSEANDLALRLAWTHTKQQDLIVIDGAYHGNLSSLVAISPYKFDGPGGRGAPPYVQKIPTPDTFQGPYKRDDPQAGNKYAEPAREAIGRIQSQGRGPAAFIFESLMGCAGQIVFPDGFLQAACSHVREAGGVCIADEVQVGFGRVGTHFWGFDTQGIVPDIVTMGKPIGNGHPLAAVATTPEIAASFNTGMEYFNTFGGNPVSCAVGLAVLDVIRDERLQENAQEVGKYLQAGLHGLAKKHPLIGDVRGMGLFLGVELVLDRKTLRAATAEASYVAERMKERGILISTDGPYRNVLKIKPPLCFNKRNADFFIETMDGILNEDTLSFRE